MNCFIILYKVIFSNVSTARGLSSYQCQSARMSKITNDGLTRSGT